MGGSCWGCCRQAMALPLTLCRCKLALAPRSTPAWPLQLTGLQLQCSHLTRLAMQGNRNLQEVCCACCARCASCALLWACPYA